MPRKCTILRGLEWMDAADFVAVAVISYHACVCICAGQLERSQYTFGHDCESKDLWRRFGHDYCVGVRCGSAIGKWRRPTNFTAPCHPFPY